MCNRRNSCGCGSENELVQLLEEAKAEACYTAEAIETAEKKIRKTIEAIAAAILAAEETDEDCGCDCGCNTNSCNSGCGNTAYVNSCGYDRNTVCFANGNTLSYRDVCG